MFVRSIVLAAAMVAHAAVSQVHAQEPLRIEDVYRTTQERNPRLHAAAALVRARQSIVPSAGLLPDPEVQFGAMNFSVPGFSADMAISMVPSVQVMQMLPLFGKLGLSERIAEQSTEIARASAAETWWEVRAEAAMAFYEVYRADRELAVMQETLRLLQDLRKVAQAMYSAGEGRQADLLRAGVEVTRMEADIARMKAMRVSAATRLNAVMNVAPDAPVGTPELPPLPSMLPTADTLRSWAEVARPMLIRGRTEVEQARSKLELARREIWPDLAVGVQYGQRRSSLERKTARMGSMMIGFSVPLFAGKRQLKMREEAEAMREMAQADLAGMRAEIHGRIGELVANLERNRTLIHLYANEILPQADANVQSSLSSYRVGQVDFMTLIDAQMTANEYRQEMAALVAGYGSNVAELEATIGRELPVTVPLAVGGK